MRGLLFLFCLIATPATAWEFTANPVCRLSHETGDVSVTVEYDPRRVEAYSIAIKAPVPWPDAAMFGLTFTGPRGLTITTPNHALSADGTTLTVRDRGFGNVLNGIEFNQSATAFAGETRLPFSLDGAADPLNAFRACSGQLTV